MIRLLPQLQLKTERLSLPLAPHTCRRLLEVALDEDPASRTHSLVQIVSADAALALWSSCRFTELTNRRPRDLHDLADWLSRQAARIFVWSDDDPRELRQSSAASYDRFREVATYCLSVAITCAARVAAAQQSNAWLLGLLYNASDWLMMDAQQDSQAAAAALPSWITGVYGRLGFPTTTDPVEVGEQLSECVGGVDEQAARTVDAVMQQRERAGRIAASVWPPLTNEPLDCRHECPQPSLETLLRRLSRWRDLEHRFEETLEREKLAAMQQLAYGASHEINNPLANISTRAQTLLQGEQDPEKRKRLATINSQAFRAHEMISNMMLFAKPPALNPGAVDLGELTATIAAELAEAAAGQGTAIEVDVPEELPAIEADRDQLTVALKSLCTNSLEALQSGGTVRVSVSESRSTEPVAGHWFEITVSDTGPGIPPEVRRHAFDPFYSGREAGRGLGFGLSKCWAIVNQHGGSIVVDSPATGGVVFTLILPATQEHA